MSEKLASEKIVVASPMSFSGSAARLLNLSDNLLVRVLFIVPAILFWWCLVALWYMFFGIFLIPFRLVMRGSRKRKRDEARHRELLQAVKEKSDAQ